MLSAQVLGVLLIFLLIVFVMFLIGREFICWYYKINERLSVLEKIQTNLDVLMKRFPANSSAGSIPTVSPNSLVDRECRSCGKSITPDLRYCESCGARN